MPRCNKNLLCLPFASLMEGHGATEKMTARKTDGQMRSLTARSPQGTEFQRLCYSARPNDVALGFGFFTHRRDHMIAQKEMFVNREAGEAR